MDSSSASSSSSALLAGSSSPSAALPPAGEEEDEEEEVIIPATPPPPKKYIRDTKNGKLKINSEYELYMKSKTVSKVSQSIVTTATIASLSTTASTTTTTTTPLQSTTSTTTPNNSVVIIDESTISSQSSQLQQSSQWVPLIATTTTAAAATTATTTAITNGTTAAVTTMTMTMTAAEEEETNNENENEDHDNIINKEDDCDKIPLAYLARVSREVYNFDNDSNDNNTNTNEIIEVGPDKFSIHCITTTSNKDNESKQILIIAICGTFSPIQHIMNIMPHAYQTLYTVKEIFNSTNNNPNNNGSTNNGTNSSSSLKDVQSSMRNLTHNNSNGDQNALNEQYDAYTAGHEHGWTEPARKIYEEIVIRVASCDGFDGDDGDANTAGSISATTDVDADAADSNIDLNDLFDTIIITGHSRGGLLAYYVGLNFLNTITAANKQSYSNDPIIRVIGFGMPSPLKEVSDNDYRTKQFIQNSVISIVNRYDPVANNTLPTTTPLVNWWNPILVEIGPKIKSKPSPPPPPQLKKESSKKKTTGSGLWGLVSNVVSIAVNAVTDKATELKYDIENNHTIYQYEQFMTINNTNNDQYNNEDNDNYVILPSCVVIINDNDCNNDIDSGNSNCTSSPGTPSSTSSTLQLLLPSSSK